MPRLRRATRKLPWMTYVAVGRVIVERGSRAWRALTPRERDRLQRILRDARLRPDRIPAHERNELREIVTKGVKAAARRH
jgi:hypothetical protein